MPVEPIALIRAHFPSLDEGRLARLERLAALVRDWNTRVNLVSRQDIAHLEEHHLLHSLAAARVLQPAPGTTLADLGTGGGFPGLPLAIVYPDNHFTLVDSIAKKARAVARMASDLGLSNVRVINARAELVRDQFDYVLGRSVAPLPRFLTWAAPRLRPGKAGVPASGVLYFKGTLWREELAGHPWQPSAIWEIAAMFPNRPFFAGKYLLHFAAADAGAKPVRVPAPRPTDPRDSR